MTDERSTRGRPNAGVKAAEKGRKSRKHEDRIAGAMRGRRLPGSGAIKVARNAHSSETLGGDIESAELLIEHKFVYPDTKSYAISRSTLEKVTAGSDRTHRYPAMVITFEKADRHASDWLMLPLDVARKLMPSLQEQIDEIASEK